jgi:hypothetical protein
MYLRQGLLTVGLVIVTGVAIGRGLQVTAEQYLVAPSALAESAPTARAAGLDTLQIMYREGDGSEDVFNCLTTRDLVDTNTLFTEDLAQFERLRAADCVATATRPAP